MSGTADTPCEYESTIAFTLLENARQYGLTARAVSGLGAFGFVFRRRHLHRLQVALGQDRPGRPGASPRLGGRVLLALEPRRHVPGEQVEAAPLGHRRGPVVGQLQVGTEAAVG